MASETLTPHATDEANLRARSLAVASMGFDLWAVLKAANSRLGEIMDALPEDDEAISEFSRLIRVATGMAYDVGVKALDLPYNEASHV